MIHNPRNPPSPPKKTEEQFEQHQQSKVCSETFKSTVYGIYQAPTGLVLHSIILMKRITSFTITVLVACPLLHNNLAISSTKRIGAHCIFLTSNTEIKNKCSHILDQKAIVFQTHCTCWYWTFYRQSLTTHESTHTGIHAEESTSFIPTALLPCRKCF
jgi:hypothetical protein